MQEMHQNYVLHDRLDAQDKLVGYCWIDSNGVTRKQVVFRPNGVEVETLYNEAGQKHGFVRNYHLGELQEETPYYNGIKSGKGIKYYKLSDVEIYQKIHGIKLSSRPEVEYEQTYVDDALVSKRRYDKDGHLIESMQLNSKEIDLVCYYPTGEVSAKSHTVINSGVAHFTEFYKSGKKKGDIIMYGTDCHADTEYNSMNWRVTDCAYAQYYENGKIKELRAERGNRHVKYDPAGNVMQFFPVGYEDGRVVEYHGNGKVASVVHYTSQLIGGVRHGPAHVFYENGKPEKELMFNFGSVEGKATLWNEDGSLYAVNDIRHNMLHGKQQLFENGKMVNEGYAWNDEPVSRLSYLLKSHNVLGLMKLAAKSIFTSASKGSNVDMPAQHGVRETTPEALRL